MRRELDHAAQHRREGTAACRGKAQSGLALRGAGQLMPVGTREHHEITAAHDERLALAFAVHPRLPAPDEVEDGAGCPGRIERPGAAVASLLEDARAQAEALQNVRKQIHIRRFGYEIRSFRAYSSDHDAVNLRASAATGKNLLRLTPTKERLDMTKFTVHTIETAPAASRPLLEGVRQALGFVPNLFGVFAESPAALQRRRSPSARRSRHSA